MKIAWEKAKSRSVTYIKIGSLLDRITLIQQPAINSN